MINNNTKQKLQNKSSQDNIKTTTKKSWLSNLIFQMSKFEKIFWAVILIFMLIFIIASIIASIRPDTKPKPDVVPKIYEIPLIKNNLDKNKDKIIKDRNEKLNKIQKQVGLEVDKLFKEVEDNVDIFLDFHYSVIGEYTELSYAVAGNIEELIKQKLFNKDFENQASKTFKNIDDEYEKILKEHLDTLYDASTNGVKLSTTTLKTLHNDIYKNEIVQESKLGLLIASRFAPRLVQSISTKLAGKAIIKVAAKTSAKAVAATAAGVAGITCGPFVWICSPVAAISVWFLTDVAIVYLFEALNRDAFKNEVLKSIENAKQGLKNKYNEQYSKSFNDTSEKILNQYGYKLIKVKDIVTSSLK